MKRNTVERARNGHKSRIKNKKKEVGKFGWFMSKKSATTSPPSEGESVGTSVRETVDQEEII